MADDKNGAEASKIFLEENKKKEGVITLASGLQYKVLKEGKGFDHPTVSTPCECHYAGSLLDGSEFDSSYKRGAPTTFAPNQVIKGWTEAMQLMVEGDKWEMYIPMELAYGPNGKPPKIPPAAALIFKMEIMKIKGATNPKKIEFPEWTKEQLDLWTEKDEAAVQAWRSSREKSWEDGNLKEQHPTREQFDAWLDKQSKASRDKALWKRTRRNYEAEAGIVEEKGSGGYKAAPAAPAPPKLKKESAKALLTTAIAKFKEPDNKEKLLGLLKECEGADPQQAGMMKMMKLMPAVSAMMAEPLKEHGFGPNDLLNVMMQVQAFGSEDESIAADTAKLMKAVQGDVSDLLGE
eukprot:TRINITY_DN12863_c2_g1_i1.p1 TRINITY_DN12863_c2_g1~~TRINITY_DN12863_c2_g1_i1.p1  ORF type:complete len:349 (-),score=121.95 TRINITY_DN12863_c2_g1_i1:147-1193(-)